MVNIDNIPSAPGGTEAKVKAATWATFVVSLVLQVVLASTVTDYVSALPDWLEAPGYSLVAALAAYVGGYVTRNKPDSLSPSTVDALKEWLKNRMPRRAGE